MTLEEIAAETRLTFRDSLRPCKLHKTKHRLTKGWVWRETHWDSSITGKPSLIATEASKSIKALVEDAIKNNIRHFGVLRPYYYSHSARAVVSSGDGISISVSCNPFVDGRNRYSISYLGKSDS